MLAPDSSKFPESRAQLGFDGENVNEKGWLLAVGCGKH
jgi:hypothetical protein